MIPHDLHCDCAECNKDRERVDQIADLIREKESLLVQRRKLRGALGAALVALDQEALMAEKRTKRKVTNCSAWHQVRAIGRQAMEESK